MPNEPIQGGPYPLLSDAANVPDDIKKVVDWAAPKMNMTLSSTGERDAQVPSPTEGMECCVGAGSSAVKYIYGSGAWITVSMGAVMGKRDGDRKSTRLNSSHVSISYAVFCLNKRIT